ncbi:MAG: hypothetical protein DLM72_17770 [Candidatus Nitrosopolaris wilkensis]|nr:MAG: hypothetical protein DLM72_17770 [Candidatus Nitrosopolaris wilkensis]
MPAIAILTITLLHTQLNSMCNYGWCNHVKSYRILQREVRAKTTTIELNSDGGSSIKSNKEKQQHKQDYGVTVKYRTTSGPIHGIEEAIRNLIYWKDEVLDLEIFEGCIEPMVSSSTSSEVCQQKNSIHMTPRDGLCQARGCKRQFDIETKIHRYSGKEDKINPDLFLCEYDFYKNRTDDRELKTKSKLSVIW